MDINKLLKEAESLQKNLTKVQDELAHIDVTGTSGGGSVTVLMTAQGAIKDIKIKKEVVNPDDIETLEDLVLAALKDATVKAVEISQSKLGNLTGGLGGLPGF